MLCGPDVMCQFCSCFLSGFLFSYFSPSPSSPPPLLLLLSLSPVHALCPPLPLLRQRLSMAPGSPSWPSKVPVSQTSAAALSVPCSAAWSWWIQTCRRLTSCVAGESFMHGACLRHKLGCNVNRIDPAPPFLYWARIVVYYNDYVTLELAYWAQDIGPLPNSKTIHLRSHMMMNTTTAHTFYLAVFYYICTLLHHVFVLH